MTTTTPRLLTLAVMAAALSVAGGCGGGSSSSTDPSEQTAATAAGSQGDTASSVVFTPETVRLLDVEGVVEVPSGGHAAAGLVCRGSSGDIAYVGVSGVRDGLYVVTADGVPSGLTFTTGSPSSGRGAGARQGSFDDESYTFEFTDLDVEVTIPGCS